MRFLFTLCAMCVAGIAPAQVVVPAQGTCTDGKCQLKQALPSAPFSHYKPYYVVPKKSNTLTFEVYKIDTGKWGWVLKQEADEIGRSVKTYETKAKAMAVAQELFGTARTVVVSEQENTKKATQGAGAANKSK